MGVLRVDGKDGLPQRRLSFDCKTSKFSLHGDGGGDGEKVGGSPRRPRSGRPGELTEALLPQGPDRISKITSDENLADPVHAQLFTGEHRLRPHTHTSKTSLC